MVRDASGHLLPFSTIGGFVLGARAITLHGVGWAAATATTVVDVTAEFIAELAFAMIGLVVLLVRSPGSSLIGPVMGVVVAAIAGSALLVWLQRGGAGIFRSLGRRIAGNRFQAASERLAQMGLELDRIYSNPLRLGVGAALHLLGWIGTAFETWIAYRLLGVPVDFATALVIEALLRAVLTAAFVVPAAVGVQEAAYTGFGAMLGLPAEVSLGVSLLRRARDIVLGVPILMIWQGVEAKRLAEEA
jgi:putative membrane protein